MTGLQLPDVSQIGVGCSDVQDIESVWRTANHIENEIHEKGIVDTPSPRYECPEVDPERFSSSDGNEVTRIYLQFNGWFSYIAEILSKVTIYILEYENMIEHLEAHMREQFRQLTERGKKLTKEEVNDKIIVNPKHIELTRQLQQYKQYKIRLQARADALEKSVRMVSRQVEIRRQEIEFGHVNQPAPNPGWGASRGRFGQ